MSYWTHISGCVCVSPLGRTQHEKTYILHTVLEHLPHVTGSEGDMHVHVVQKSGHDALSSHDEFGNHSRYTHGDCIDIQTEYVLVVEADLRNRRFIQTYREFVKWLTRLSKRVMVEDVLVRIEGDCDASVTLDGGREWHKLFELPSWSAYNPDSEPTWSEYLMWKPVSEDVEFPAVLAYKYFDDDQNDKRVDGWLRDDQGKPIPQFCL